MCLDGFMNIALEQTEEYVGGVCKEKLGDAFIRGNNGEAPRRRLGARSNGGGRRPAVPHAVRCRRAAIGKPADVAAASPAAYPAPCAVLYISTQKRKGA